MPDKDKLHINCVPLKAYKHLQEENDKVKMRLMRRQAIQISINELRKLADELFIELVCRDYKKPLKETLKQKCQVNIINKYKTSDTWELE